MAFNRNNIAWYVDFGDGASTGYWGVTSWTSATTKVCGNIVRQTAPAAGLEHVFVCVASTSGTGTTSGLEPTWNTTIGSKTTDNTVTWQEITGQPALNGDLTNCPTWADVKNTAITLGQVIVNVARNLVLICTTAGTAGNGTEPSWAAFTNAGATTADNTATWTTLGSSFTNWGAPQPRLQNLFGSGFTGTLDKIFVASEHAETKAGFIQLLLTGSNINQIFIYCVDKNNVPPTVSNLTTGASVTASGANSLEIEGGGYIRGITFVGGTSGSTSLLIGTTQGGYMIFENCSLQSLGPTAFSTKIRFGTQSAAIKTHVTLANTSLGFGSTSDQPSVDSGTLRWLNTASAFAGTPPTNLFRTGRSAFVEVRGVDLSGITGSLCTGDFSHQVTFEGCKLSGSGTVVNTTASSIVMSASDVYVVRSDSAGRSYRHEKYSKSGSQVVETTVTRTGGATDRATPVSWKIVTFSTSTWDWPFESAPIEIWNSTTGSSVTATVFGIWGGGAVPNNDDVWIEAQYMGSTLTPVASFVNSTKSNGLASGSALTSDASSWGGSTTAFKMSVSFTPQLAGPVTVRVFAAKPSTTFYIDPKAVLS